MNKQNTLNIWSAAQLCQNFWVESNITRSRVKRLSPHFRSFCVCTPACHPQHIYLSIPKRQLALARTWQQTHRHSAFLRSFFASSYSTTSYSHQQQTSSSKTVLSAALEQSDAATAHSLVDITLQLLRRRNPELAWECYTDLASRDLLRYVTTDQFRQLIKQFNHNTGHAQGLEYVLTLVEDMKHLGYQVGRKEKLLVMRLLGLNGKLVEMEKVFSDLGSPTLTGAVNSEHVLLLDPSQLISTDSEILKPYNIMLSSYQEHANTVGTKIVVQKSIAIYTDVLDFGIRPSSTITRLLMENIRLGGHTDDTVELVWDWFWNKIGMNVGGKSRDLEPSLYKEMVMYFTSAGRPEYGIEVNDIMTKKSMPKDRRMMTALIHKVGRAGDIDKALDLLNDMMTVQKIMPDNMTFNALIDIYTHKKPKPDFAGAGQMYKMMQETGLQPDVYTFGTLINMFAKEGDLTMVYQLFKDIQSHHIVPTSHIYSSLIECFINNDDQRSALEVLRILHRYSSDNKNNKRSSINAQPNEVMYNLLVKSYVEKTDLRRAFILIDLLKKADLVMDAQVFTPVIAYYADQGDVKGAQMVMNKMKSYQVDGNAFTYTALLEAYCRAEDMEGAEELFIEYKRRWRPSAYTFNNMLYMYIKKNQVDKVFMTYKQMLKTFIKMTEHTYGLLMYFYSQRREPLAVEALMNTMQSNGIVPSSICWSILMQSYFRTQRSADARKVMEQMNNVGVEPTWTTWSTLVNGLVQDGEVELAESVMKKTLERQKMQQDSHLADIKQHFSDYAKLANINLNATTHGSKKRSSPFSLSDEIVYTQALPTTIEDLLERRQRDSHRLPRVIPPAHIFTPLVHGYTRLAQFDKARDVINTMMEWEVTINQTIYSTLMKLYHSEQRYDVVDCLWDALRNHYKPSSLSSSPSHVYVDGLGQIPLPKRNQLLEENFNENEEDRLLLALKDQPDNDSEDGDVDADDDGDNSETAFSQQPATLSPYILSTYADALIEQQRYEDVHTAWHSLQQEDYVFDEHNWNRYTVSLIRSDSLTEACKIAYEYLLEADERERKRDKRSSNVGSSNYHHPLHRRTCLEFAEVFDIPGYSGMGSPRLRSVVTEKINHLIKTSERETTMTTSPTSTGTASATTLES